MTAPTSRLSQARKAVRPAFKGRMMLSGPSGAGKTRCGLIIATELAEGGPILGVDTEKESMLTYADDFDFIHLPWHPPFDALELAAVIGEAGSQYAVIFVDSATHFWRKEGGVLDIAGGKFTGWKEARPIQESLVEAFLNCGAHVILGARSKVDHVQEVEGGRQVVRKLGMAVQQDDDLEFELNVAIDLSMDHTATVSKSRTTALPVGRAFRGGQMSEMATIYREWLKGGEEPVTAEVAKGVRSRLDALEGEQYRRRCKAEFKAAFGTPEQLHESALEAVNGLIDQFYRDQPDETSRVEGSEAEGEPAPKTRSKAKSPGEQLHRDLGGLKIGADDQRALIICCSSGRTEHASELSEKEITETYLMGKDVAEGRLPIEQVYSAIETVAPQPELSPSFT